ncbi:putative hydrolase of the HAD superfamily [Streptomyces sp. 840.1]|uniref:HAD family hydrolase n=1 Tax=Streptomyces sp. 840.1 TaxID=2485152 RepID=UPI000F4A67C0|nr:HAD family phosphatase [Streptomyces sp. 840.1]ROQ68175.1 putative hydrolase of the HAD superfamily [Streptomyces sp. 840.1]
MSDTTSPPLAVWSDFGGVLTPPLGHTMKTFCDSMGLDQVVLGRALATVTARYGTTDIMLPIDTPLVTEEEWLREVGDVLEAEHGVRLRLTTMADAWFDGRETNHAWLAQLRKIRERGAFVGMLSNMVPAWDPYWRRMIEPDGLWDDVLLSFEVGHRKPSPGMFELAARRAGVPPERCVLVDDLPQNCAGAEALGWQTVLFTDAESAGDRLASLWDDTRRKSA